ncbi:hypothetical protein pdam_00016406 [Pocillopora damicornis]|uniref:Uncharacterized protein n=1 Tax=Pocillopora damicornis TaxID=46731 RepID=A0A3M6URM0_POCDA|nr:putative GPI-anchored protein pfl2 [Pocillopora damicornis]RMX55988.1 hypothetical protein pdam_00016406 [Pocillopora damicornis]
MSTDSCCEMSELWVMLALLFCFTTVPPSFATGPIYSSQSKSTSSVLLSTFVKVESNEKEFSSFFTVPKWTTTTLPSKTKKQSGIYSSHNNEANGRLSPETIQPILSSLSKVVTAPSRTNLPTYGTVLKNISPKGRAEKFSSFKNLNGFSSVGENMSAVSLKPALTIPEIATTTSRVNFFPSMSEMKKYLDSSQTRDYFNGDNPSRLSDLQSRKLIDQTAHFSNENSILGHDNNSGTSVGGSRLFTKGSLSLTKQNTRSSLLQSSLRMDIKTTQSHILKSVPSPLFSVKVSALLTHATRTCDTNMITASVRALSSSHGMPKVTTASKIASENNLSQISSSPASTPQMTASSWGHSSAEKENFTFTSIVKPSIWSRERNRTPHTSGVATAFPETPSLKHSVSSDANYMFTLIDESESLLLKIRYTEEFSSRVPSSTLRVIRSNTSHSSARDIPSIPFHKTFFSAPHETATTSLDSPSISSSKAQAMTKKRATQSSVQSADLTLSSTSQESFFKASPSQRPHILRISQGSANFSTIMQERDFASLSRNQVAPSSSQNKASQHGTDLSTSSFSKIQSSSVVWQRKSPSPTSVAYSGTTTTLSTSTSRTAQNIQSSSLRPEKRFTPLSSTVQSSSMLHYKRNLITTVSFTKSHMSSSTSTTVHQIRSSSKMLDFQSTEIRFLNSSSKIIHQKRSTSSQHIVKLRDTVLQTSNPSFTRTSSRLSKTKDSSTTPFRSQGRLSASISSTSSWKAVMPTRQVTPSSPVQRGRGFGNVSLTTLQVSLTTISKETENYTISSSSSLSKLPSTRKIIPSSSSLNIPSVSRRKSSPFAGMSHSTPRIVGLTISSANGQGILSSSTLSRFASTSFPLFPGTKGLSRPSSRRSSVHKLASSSTTIQTQISASVSWGASKMLPSSSKLSSSSTESPLPVNSHIKSFSQVPEVDRSTSSKDQNSISFPKSIATTYIDKSKLQTSPSPMSTTLLEREIPFGTIVPFPGESSKTYKATKTDAVLPTRTRPSTDTVATAPANISTESPSALSTNFGQIRLLIIVAIIPSVLLCAFFSAFLLFRRSRKRRNKSVYSIKLEYADENSGFRKRCVNSRLDLSLKGIHIDLEFPYDCERRGSYVRDSYSRGSALSETQMRELQILSQECKENMEWISEVIAREMEASISGRNLPVTRDSVYSLKERENFEPSEKLRSIVRRESSKRGRETVKWKIPVVQRRDSEDFDQRDSMCTDDTTLEWKDGQRSTPRNCGENGKNICSKSNHALQDCADEDNLDKGFKVQTSNETFDNNETRENGKKENNVVESKPPIVDFNLKKDDIPREKRSSSRPKRPETL